MKFIERILGLTFLCALMIIMSENIFAQNSFEMSVNLNAGASVGFKNERFDYDYISKDGANEIRKKTKADIGSEIGTSILIGYKIDLIENLSVSVLGEIGYNYDFLGYGVKQNNEKWIYWFQLHTFVLGVNPKLNWKNFSFGIGSGIKIPFSGNYYQSKGRKHFETESKNYWYAPIANDELSKFYFKQNVIPYLKITFDYNLFVHKKVAVTFGAYAGYDFGIETKNNKAYYKKISLSGFDFGISVGTRFLANN